MWKYYRCYASISLAAIRRNLENVRRLLPEGTALMAVLKADAYGHGAVTVGKHIADMIDAAGVASVEEGIELREAGLTMPILVLAYASPGQFADMLAYDIMPTIYNRETAERYSEAAVKAGKTGKYHIALDTGMTRIGFRINAESADAIREIADLPGISLHGLFSHLSCADTEREEYSENQFAEYEAMLAMLDERGVRIPVRHLCNSAGIMKYKDRYYDGVRSGIVTYGMYPSEEVEKSLLALEPALEWKTHVIHVSETEAGRGVSYGATFVTDREKTRIATLSVGYADGYPRSLSSKGCVLIRGKRAPIIGRVCMDQMMVDVTDIPDVAVEDVATLIGRDGEEFLSIEEVAEKAGSFNYEMACGIGKRVKRVYKQ